MYMYEYSVMGVNLDQACCILKCMTRYSVQNTKKEKGRVSANIKKRKKENIYRESTGYIHPVFLGIETISI